MPYLKSTRKSDKRLKLKIDFSVPIYALNARIEYKTTRMTLFKTTDLIHKTMITSYVFDLILVNLKQNVIFSIVFY